MRRAPLIAAHFISVGLLICYLPLSPSAGILVLFGRAMYFDSHVHFDQWEADGCTDAVIARALAAGVERILAVGGSEASNAAALAAAARFPQQVRAAIGLDRHEVGNAEVGSRNPSTSLPPSPSGFGEASRAGAEVGLPCEAQTALPSAAKQGTRSAEIEAGNTEREKELAAQVLDRAVMTGDAESSHICPELCRRRDRQSLRQSSRQSLGCGRESAFGESVVAVGEIGLDFHYAPETAEAQVALFRGQLAQARELGLPVIVHSREADAETLSELRAHAAAWTGAPERIGVLHCFTGGRAFAEALLNLGFHISFSGIVTFRNADVLREVAAAVPAERLLMETDSPYLAPVPMRGQANEPAFLVHVAETLASVRGCPVDEIARVTTANAQRLFDG